MSIMQEIVQINKNINSLMHKKYERIEFVKDALSSESERAILADIINELLFTTHIMCPYNLTDEIIVALNMIGCTVCKISKEKYLVQR